jgi:hypothetical protein
MVAQVDRFQKRVEMLGGPALGGRRDQDDRLTARFEALLPCLVPTLGISLDDERLGLPFPGFEQVE